MVDAFITSVPTVLKNKKRISTDKLVNVRKDHAQLMDIVKKFGSKVSTMVDNQRIDYMAAYENHMLDVQKELYLLREKVQEIATDGTRDEKIKSLQDAQTKYKSESVSLDQQNNEMRKKLRALTVTMQSAERDRDWLLARLRKAKKKYGILESEFKLERSKNPAEEYESDSIASAPSHEDSLLLGLYKLKINQAQGGAGVGIGAGTGTGTAAARLAPIALSGSLPAQSAWKGRLAATVAMSRADPFGNSASIADRTGGLGSSRICSAPSLYRQLPLLSIKNRNERNKFDRNNTSMLVTMRERKKGVRDSIEKCLIHVEKCPPIDQGSGFNSLSELVIVCLESLEEMKVMQRCGGSNNNHREGEEEEHRLDQYLERQNDHRAWLVTLLCTYPETFHAILDIIASKFAPVTSEKSQSSVGSEFQSIESSASQGVIENLANFDSTSWLNSESDANSAKRLSNINKLKSLKSLLGSRSMESLTGHLSTAGATDNEIRKHNFTASVDSIDGKATAREEPDQSDDVVDWSQDPWGGFTDSVVTEGCEAGGSGAPASKTEHPARRDVVIAPVRVVGGRGKGGSLGSTRVRPSFASRADATRR